MIQSVALWFVKSLALLVLTILAFPLSYVFALFIVKAEESEVTGFPSLYPGMPRDFLIPCLRIWQTPDAPVDEIWYAQDYDVWPVKGKTQADYDSSAWLRYLCRVVWLQRNAAYGFGSAWGYDIAGLTPITTIDNESKWRTGANCFSLWTCTNAKNQFGWCIRAQAYFYRDRCLEFYLGYKLVGDTIQGKKLVAIQVSPFKKYPKVNK
jgi:hypothetical protein